MSFQSMTWAVQQQCSSSGEKLTLLMLANHCNGHSGKCIPSHKLLAAECSMGVSTLKRHLQALADKELLTIIPRSKDGVQIPNQYHLNLSAKASNLDEVGPNRAGDRSDLGRGVGPNRATNQEIKPGREPGDARKLAPTPPQARKSSKALTSLPEWMAQLTEAGEKAIPDADPVRSYAAQAGIPDHFLVLAWVEFKARYSEPDATRYRDWRAVFRKAVRNNWLKLWFLSQDGYQLTTAGKQAALHLENDE